MIRYNILLYITIYICVCVYAYMYIFICLFIYLFNRLYMGFRDFVFVVTALHITYSSEAIVFENRPCGVLFG